MKPRLGITLVTHSATLWAALLVMFFIATLNCESHTVLGWAMPDIVRSHDRDPIGPRRWVAFEVVVADDQTHVLTDAGRPFHDLFGDAMRLMRQEALLGKSVEWHQVRIGRSVKRHTGVVFPVIVSETFIVQAVTYEPFGTERVPDSARRAAVDAFVAAWPVHAEHAAALISQDRVERRAIDRGGVVMELVSFGLIAIIVAGLWVRVRRRLGRRADARTPALPGP